MSGKRYTDQRKIKAVRQVTEHRRPVAEAAQRMGITSHSLYAWKTAFYMPTIVKRAELNQSAKVRRLKAAPGRPPPRVPLAETAGALDFLRMPR